MAVDLPQYWGRVVSVYAAGHGLMEFCCALQVAWLAQTTSHATGLVLTFNAAAFLGPILWAFFLTRLPNLPTGGLALIGALVVTTGSLVGWLPTVGIVLIALGNGAYHLAAGTATLRLPRYPVAAVGLFEGPGSVGRISGLLLGLGPLAAHGHGGWHWPLALLVLAVGLVTFRLRVDIAQPTHKQRQLTGLSMLFALTALAALSVLRASTGDAVTPLPTTGWVLWGAGLAIFFGRSAGGLLAEWLGLAHIAAVGFGLAALMLLFAPDQSVTIWLALFALGLPMAPILGGLARHLPGKEPLAFGCAQVFQFAGALLATLSWTSQTLAVVVAACGAVAVLALQGPKAEEVWPKDQAAPTNQPSQHLQST
ncbi:MAG: hypothetical protein FWG16_03205 [Micrococcales bacterium]|nr:hypothetical protein [Micrococcales bacterium]